MALQTHMFLNPKHRQIFIMTKMKAMEYKMAVTTLLCISIGFLLGSIVRELYESQTRSFYSPLQNLDNPNMFKIYMASDPCKAAELAQLQVKGPLDFSLQDGVNTTETKIKAKYLLAIAVGIQQRDLVNKMVSKFSEDFALILFHYDGKTSEWDQLEWSERAIHITGLSQTKWWFAKRFLHPDIVAEYEYIFIWDEDLGVGHFNGEEYIKLVKKHDLEISQPGITTRYPVYKITTKRNYIEVHKEANENCTNPLRPPCAGFVEIMAPVFSRKSWNCVWDMLQNDLVHAWGLDFQFWRCVKIPHINIGVVDAQWIEHLVLPTLGSQDESIKKSKGSQRLQTRQRSYQEWKEFGRRMRAAELQQNATQTLKP